MTLEQLLDQLAANDIRLRRNGDRLDLYASGGVPAAHVLDGLRIHKPALLGMIGDGGVWPPAIRPEMLPLVSLTQAEIDAIVAGVPGGAANVQDIYPLAPLQDGILFHHRMAKEGDPYLVGTVVGFETRENLDRFMAALQAVIDRQDILRTAITWDGLRDPVQVVWRKAPLPVEEVHLDPAKGDAARQLEALFDPRTSRIDLSVAPMMRAWVAYDAAENRWLLHYLRHHIVMDHATTEMMWLELEAHISGRAAELAPPLPFRNYIAQAKLGTNQETHRAFFTELLGDVEETTAPFGMLDARGDGTEMREARMEVDPGLAARLRERARVLGVSAASLFHLAWARLLARASGRDDVVFGTVLVGRMHGGEGSERVMGPFINTLPIRLRVGEVGVEEAVRQTHALLSRLLRHEHASLALAQRCSGVEAPAPLFTALLNYRNNVRNTKSRVAKSLPTLAATMKRVSGEERTNYPLTMPVDDLGDGFRLKAQVVAASLDPAQICAYMHTALEQLADALETAPGRPISTVDILPAGERDRVLHAWNRTDADFPADACVHQLFEARAEADPNATALVHEGEEIPYGELNARANRLAHYLVSVGVTPGARVALALGRSAELVEAELAVLKCGAAYVPLDPDHPDERLREMLDDSAPAALLTTSELQRRFAGVSMPVVLVDAESWAWGFLPDTNPSVEGVTAEHLAYVMYTSGSTGRPRGVMVPHRAISRLVINNGYADFSADDRVAFAANPAFDASTLEVWAPLLSGGAIVIIPQDTLLDPARFAKALRKEKITVLWLTVGLFNQYAEPLRDEWAYLRYLIVGGDALDPQVIARVLKRGGPEHLLNGYGPTETTTFAITHEITRVEEGARGIPLGRPIANTRVYVLDARGEPVAAGVAGEIWIGGAGVARGYQGRPEQTAERFVADPFGGEPGARLYRTGDLGRWRPDGTIEFLGRTDHQVKVRGFRIELGEIEARLRENPGVREAVVLVREDTPGDKRLVAYVVGDEAGAEALKEHLGARLPEYMVPAAYVRLAALPLTPNGKVDRRALPAPEGEAYATGEYEAPVGAAETALAEIWAEVLGVEQVGRWDNFFDLGGHSLLAVQVISRVQQVMGIELDLGELFNRPVLGELAEVLETAEHSELPPVEPAPRDGHIPLSFAQQRLWFLEQLGNLGSAYHIRRNQRFRGELDRTALLRALDAIVTRHEALRTTFAEVDGVPEQRIAPAEASRFHLVEHDLTGEADAEAELRRIASREGRAPFDLARGPLIRGRLVRLAADDHVLLLTMHHVVGDGWSTGALFGELFELYAAYSQGREAQLPHLPIQYADYAVWQRRWLEGDVLQEQADFWKRTLAGAPELLALPADHPRPARMDHTGGQVNVRLDEDLTAALQALSRRHETTLFMTLLAGWAVVLGRLAAQDDVVIGSPTAGRGRREIEELIGFFVQTLALRVDLSGAPTVGELLRRVKAHVLEAQQHQDIPFEQVVELAAPARSLSHSPLFQVLFTWQSTPNRGGVEVPGLVVEEMERAAHRTAKFDLSLMLSERNGRIGGSMTYATALFERQTVERWVGYLRRVLEEMAADDTLSVDRLSLVAADERNRVIDEWNRTEAEYPAESCIHHLIEAQAARTPNATAVVSDDGNLTYADLNVRANRLAHHLRALGVGPDAPVGICLDRSLEMVIGLLAVLKAGGAYIPLDPEYPADRLAYMLADAAPAVVLTQTPLRDRVGSAGVPVIDLDADFASWADQPATDLDRGSLTPEHLAYVIYTSGSTGRPKGVMNQHRTLVNRLSWGMRTWEFDATEAVLCKTSLNFDGSVREIFLPLMAGGRVVLARPGGQRDPSYLLDVIAGEGITTVNLVPSMLQVLLEDADVDKLRGLERILCGGEALPNALLERFVQRLPEVELHNLYGPSEAATAVALPRPVAEAGRATVPIGRPVSNTRVYVLDHAGEPVPVGVAGELHIGGAGVARGYLGRANQTAERFVADPFSAEPGARMYRTGDRVRWLDDGTLEFLGRTDFQLKIRGFRIEPGEIEARLREHPAVRESVVVAREDASVGTRLIAYVVGDEVAADVLRAHLAGALPEYMVPAAFVRLDALPLGPSGKLDRAALPAPEDGAYAAREYEAPEGETEEALAEIWSRLLGVERIGRRDSFFELGGHSLLATRLVARIRGEMDIDFALRTVFEKPRLFQLAQHVLDAQLEQFDPLQIERLTDLVRAEAGD